MGQLLNIIKTNFDLFIQEMSKTYTYITKTYPRNRRFCSIFDRRKSKKKGNDDDTEELIIYEPTRDSDKFPANEPHVPMFYFETSRTCLIPGYDVDKNADQRERLTTGVITSRSHCNSGIMTLSFHVESVDEIRCYLYMNGQSLRFQPEDIILVLSKFFDPTFGSNANWTENDEAQELIDRMNVLLRDAHFDAFLKQNSSFPGYYAQKRIKNKRTKKGKIAKTNGTNFEDNDEDLKEQVSGPPPPPPPPPSMFKKDIPMGTKCKVMKNPYVIIVGISEYDEPTKPLPGVLKDVANMKDLWMNKAKYKNVSVMTEEEGTYITMDALMKYVKYKASRIELFEADHKDELAIDGLIFIFSGHGINKVLLSRDYLLSSDNRSWALVQIQNIFATTLALIGKPKIFYIDACRGNSKIYTGQTHKVSKGNGDSQAFVTHLSDFFTHFAPSSNYVSYEEEGLGGHLIQAVYKYYGDRFEKKQTVKLLEAGVDINGIIHQDSEAYQTPSVQFEVDFRVEIKAGN